MEQNIDHILNYNDVIKEFNVSKRVSKKELDKIHSMVNRACDDEKRANELFQKELTKYTNNYLKTHTIPGVIIKKDDGTFDWARKIQPTPQSSAGSSSDNKLKQIYVMGKKHKEIQRDAICLSNFLTNNKKLTEKQLIFFILSLIDATGLKQEDFDEFYKNLNENGLDEEGDNEMGDDEGGDMGDGPEFPEY